METIKNTFLLLLTIVVIILFVDKCSQEPCGSDGEVISSKTETTHFKDSSFVHYKDSIDTWVHHAYVEVPEVIPEGFEEEYHTPYFPPVREYDLSDTTEVLPKLYTFYYGKADSSLKYSIKVVSEIKPFKLEMEYDLLQRTILDSTHTEVHDSTFTKQIDKVRVNQLYYGVEAVVYPNLQAAFVGVDWVSKKGFQIEAGIGVDITNQNLMGKVGFKKLLSFRKK